ncbi:sigma factor-like helix-turn-helix DNA-binding protein [Agrobacterium tumefaciens]|uniref:sigma factor-like helix-turn-helix DNA-binding protein n=1 Tax=Agrobacterium tumefaciens TaxID=358 RepID=UPI003B9DD68A
MLSAMPGRTKEVFLLSQFDGLKYGEIAARLNLSLATVKRHMHRAFLVCLTAQA